MADQQSVKHHINPCHLLARFENEGGGLTVVRRDPWKVLRNQAPKKVGYVRWHNTRRNPDGTRDDVNERLLANLDGIGAAELDEVIRFGKEKDAETHLRLLDMSLEHRANLQLFIAALMARTPGFRKRFKESALPTLVVEMKGRLDAASAAGEIDPESYEALMSALETPGHIEVEPPKNRDVDVMFPLILKIATRLHLDTLVGVRRFSKPLLLTGGEPVVVFPNADFSQGQSAGELLFAADEDPIQTWQELDTLLEQVDQKLQTMVALAVAVDPQTMLLMFHADKAEGGKAAFIASKVRAEGLAGIVNALTTASSDWIAGRDDCKMLSLLVQSAYNHGAARN